MKLNSLSSPRSRDQSDSDWEKLNGGQRQFRLKAIEEEGNQHLYFCAFNMLQGI
jgi:hypothetical protein